MDSLADALHTQSGGQRGTGGLRYRHRKMETEVWGKLGSGSMFSLSHVFFAIIESQNKHVLVLNISPERTPRATK